MTGCFNGLAATGDMRQKASLDLLPLEIGEVCFNGSSIIGDLRQDASMNLLPSEIPRQDASMQWRYEKGC